MRRRIAEQYSVRLRKSRETAGPRRVSIPIPQLSFPLQRFLATDAGGGVLPLAGARTVEVNAGHLSLITRSDAVERLILDAVRTTR